ncbi:MAG: glycine cleavage system aminomethyltransferase GcvT [Thermoplasmata archaeon]|nr:glycine cleavage system aminomethyltransferase GcvT [Thermoplasmata archaeon]MCI4359565.1 glycine cleavage system aminomethyltransferase GcvT [Thermoplasmata archaeon]
MSSVPRTPPAPAEALPLLRTPLFPFHEAHHAHLVPFAGWEMPLYYEGILAEHQAVRSAVGLFDVSHMGILTVHGASAAALLARRTTADVLRLTPGRVRYTFLLNLEGQIIDDLLITRVDRGGDEPPSYVVVPNAATASRVYDLLRQHRRPDTTIGRHNGRVAILAVQGPKAPGLLEATFGWALGDLAVYHARLFGAERSGPVPRSGRLGVDLERDLADGILVSRTGYTGEAGAELFVRGDRAVEIAERLVEAGARPVGLGARDTLRLEKGYLLSGQDFHEDRTPLEAAQDRFVEMGHAFVGRESLEKQRTEGLKVRLSGISIETPDAIPRHGTPVLAHGEAVTTVTSGGMSPTLHHGIALAYLPVALASPGTAVTVDVRGRIVPAEVVRLPFVTAPRGAG